MVRCVVHIIIIIIMYIDHALINALSAQENTCRRPAVPDSFIPASLYCDLRTDRGQRVCFVVPPLRANRGQPSVDIDLSCLDGHRHR